MLGGLRNPLHTHPGLLAPASLKHRWDLRQTPRRSSSSGAACPGLIEAHRFFSSIRIDQNSSGAACPGLIEAAPTCWCCAWSASSSGAACPGLIEADQSWGRASALPPAHPGLLAPASLKRDGLQRSVHCCRAHPGLLAPASLKPVAPGRRPLAVAPSSGAACPGLIEACPSPPRLHRPRSSSGAACPGLIEAERASIKKLMRAALIRGCLPRPH